MPMLTVVSFLWWKGHSLTEQGAAKNSFFLCNLHSVTTFHLHPSLIFVPRAGVYHSALNTKGGSITVRLTSCLTGLEKSVLQLKTKIVSSHTADSKPVKQEVNRTVILPSLVFPAQCYRATL